METGNIRKIQLGVEEGDVDENNKKFYIYIINVYNNNNNNKKNKKKQNININQCLNCCFVIKFQQTSIY